jgi:nicotinamidase-related amidase
MMNENRKRNILWLVFSLVIILSYGYGLITIKYQIFPYNQIKHVTALFNETNIFIPDVFRGEGVTTYILPTYRRSYFSLTEEGVLDLKKSLPYRAEGIYYQNRSINPYESAIIVMDPWIDMASNHLNEYYGKIAESKIVPLVQAAQAKGHPVIVLTNNCNAVQYNCKITDELQDMANKKQVTIIYHQDMNDDEQFSDYLKKRKIKTLFYVGFASNMCVIGRQMGMIPMKINGFQLFFVPEASAAVEEKDTWSNQSIHKGTTKVISQWIGEIVKYDDMMKSLSAY